MDDCLQKEITHYLMFKGMTTPEHFNVGVRFINTTHWSCMVAIRWTNYKHAPMCMKSTLAFKYHQCNSLSARSPCHAGAKEGDYLVTRIICGCCWGQQGIEYPALNEPGTSYSARLCWYRPNHNIESLEIRNTRWWAQQSIKRLSSIHAKRGRGHETRRIQGRDIRQASYDEYGIMRSVAEHILAWCWLRIGTTAPFRTAGNDSSRQISPFELSQTQHLLQVACSARHRTQLQPSSQNTM